MGNDFTELQDEVITLVADNPDASSSEIAEMAEVQVAPSTVRGIWNEYPGAIETRREMIEMSESGLDEPDELGELSFNDEEDEESEWEAQETVEPEDTSSGETFELRDEPTAPNTSVDPRSTGPRFGPEFVTEDDFTADEPEDEESDESLFERIKNLFR